MDDEGFPWSSLNGNSDKYAENGEEMMDILVDDIEKNCHLLLEMYAILVNKRY
jgi:hypothetical protein